MAKLIFNEEPKLETFREGNTILSNPVTILAFI